MPRSRARRSHGGQDCAAKFAAEPEKVTAMSRKSVIQLVPTPPGRGDASDLRYRLLMAALGSSEEVNPLLVGPDAPTYDPAAAVEAEVEAESALIQANQDLPSAESRAVERSDVTGLEGQPSLSLVRPQAPSPLPVRNTADETAAPAGIAPLPHPLKRR